MEVKPGYKQTEVGVIPRDWDTQTLGKIGECLIGLTYDPSNVKSDGVLVLRASNIEQGALQFDDNVFVDMEVPEKILAKEGDLLICVRNGSRPLIGKCALIDKRAEGMTFGAFMSIFRSPHNRFIFYCFQSDLVKRQIHEHLGATINQITNKSLNSFRIPFPNCDEREMIAAALSDVDGLVGALDKLIAKKQDLKQAAMQQLLTGQTRLPGFSGEWKVKSLVSFVKCERFAIVDGPFGSQMKVDEFVPSGVPVIEMEHLKDGFIDKRIERCITPKKFEELKRSAVFPGDIVISKTGSLGYLGIIPESIEKGLITSRLAKISLDPSCADRMFIFQYLLKLRTDGYWEKVSQGGTMQILGIRMLQNAPIPDISVAEQGAIATVLSDMDVELAALEHRLAKARALKHGMMQELLTGRTRLV